MLMANSFVTRLHGWAVATVPCRICPHTLDRAQSPGSAHLSRMLPRVLGTYHVCGGARCTPAVRSVMCARLRLPDPIVANPCLNTTLTVAIRDRNSLSRERVLYRDRDFSLPGQTMPLHQTLLRHKTSRALSR